MLKRVLAALAATLVLLSAATASFGIVLLAPVGVLLARLRARRRRGVLSRGSAWRAAAVACAIPAAVFVIGLFASMPPEFRDELRTAIDSARNNPDPPPGPWLGASVTPARQSKAALVLLRHPALMLFTAVVGSLLVCALVGSVVGTVGWAASLLLAYAFTGRWIAATVNGAPSLPAARA